MTTAQLIKHTLLFVHTAGDNGITEELLLTTMKAEGLNVTEDDLKGAVLQCENVTKTLTSIADALSGEPRLYVSDRGRAALTQYKLI